MEVFPCAGKLENSSFVAVTVNVPVAFLIFRRPDLTERVFERIRQARPPKLLIVADGPQTAEDVPLCAEARRVVERVDWPCEVQRNYSEHNMGCRDRIASGLDWVFSRVPEAIVLEDDCEPCPSFFGFCETLLCHYRDSDRVMHVCGSNLLVHWPGEYSYYFSRYAHMWGWATWARAWRHMDLQMRTWREFRTSGVEELFSDKDARRHWVQKLDPFAKGTRTDTWDYPWQYSIWARGGVCVVPHTNLVANIGFREDATRTRTGLFGNLPVGEAGADLHHPPQVAFDDKADQAVYLHVFGGERTKLRKSFRYRISKPVRVYRKLRERWSASRSSATPMG